MSRNREELSRAIRHCQPDHVMSQDIVIGRTYEVWVRSTFFAHVLHEVFNELAGVRLAVGVHRG